MRVIGLDCATEDSRIGLARADVEAGAYHVEEMGVCSSARPVVSVLGEWLNGQDHVLLAVDAPLGWPVGLAGSLRRHRAGDAISVPANEMFRRDSDRFIQREIGKTPLDVGADRIARTAHAALRILAEVRQLTQRPIPLLWNPDSLNGVAAIEVYPAATLTVHAFRSNGYKGASQSAEREEIINSLRNVLALPDDTSRMISYADALDAVVCILAAKDFLEGKAMPPLDAAVAAREGWIWCAPPRSSPLAQLVPTGRIARPGSRSGRVGKQLICPACGNHTFKSWPLGWDAHVGFRCVGATGKTPEQRRTEFKARFPEYFR
jgi:predicted RNase H-like nuclease